MIEEKSQLRVAAVQMDVKGNQTENLKKIFAFMDKASKERIEVVVFPECALSGYPKDTKLDKLTDIPSLKKVDPNLIESDIDEIKKLSRKLGLWVCLGTARNRNGGWYNDALLISDKGRIEGVYSKVNLTEYSDAHHFIQGNSFPLMKLKEIPVGFQICFDMRFPENWRILKAKGAKIVFHLNHSSHLDTWKVPVLNATLCTRASENGYYLVSANDAGPLQMVQSIIVNPHGLKLAQANLDNEEMITATLNLKEVSDRFYNLRRTDLFRLQFEQ